MPNPFKALFSSRDRLVPIVQAPRRRTSLAPAVVLAAGAGAALWWWTQWARATTENAGSEAPTDDALIGDAVGISPGLGPEAAESLDDGLAVQADAERDAPKA